VKALRSLLIASLLAVATSATAQDPSPWKFEFHGFVSTSAYLQDNVTGTSVGGQIPFAARARVGTDKAIIGADVRQTRFSFAMSGPEVLGGAKPKAVIEFDFFGGYAPTGYIGGTNTPNSASAPSQFGETNLLPRLRIAYAELNWGNTIIQAGQQNQLIITAQLPVALGHIAFPICTTAGCLGWRTPGFTLIQKLPMDGFNVEAAGQISRSNWNDARSLGSNGADSFGQAGSPMFQGRVRLDGKASGLSWMGYLVGHFASIDMTGPGLNANGNGGPPLVPSGTAAPAPAYQANLANNNVAKLQSVAGQIGGKVNFAPVTVAFNAYTGKNLANIIGDMFSQFQNANPASGGAIGQIRAKGMWAQLGFDITKNWSAWLFYGNAKINPEEANRSLGNTRVANEVDAILLKYTEGAFSTGIDFANIKTSNSFGLGPVVNGVQDTHRTVNGISYARQLMYTMAYFF